MLGEDFNTKTVLVTGSAGFMGFMFAISFWVKVGE